MRIAGIYSFNGGSAEVQKRYPALVSEVKQVIQQVDASQHKTKRSTEKTMMGRMLYSPRSINKAFKEAFLEKQEWSPVRVPCTYATTHYMKDYEFQAQNRGAFREMDFVKNKLGIEVQFGKYAFMVYNVCAKMTIFHKLGHINHGIEIVPVKSFAEEMSTGVSYFEQFVWDLENRGISNIDIPVMILGIDK
ncbi:MAG: BglII/BstYI family type II restriction endonuclease [Acidobacteriaceae bacterium]